MGIATYTINEISTVMRYCTQANIYNSPHNWEGISYDLAQIMLDGTIEDSNAVTICYSLDAIVYGFDCTMSGLIEALTDYTLTEIKENAQVVAYERTPERDWRLEMATIWAANDKLAAKTSNQIQMQAYLSNT